MKCSESVSIKTLRLESEKVESFLGKQPVVYFNNEELTGWDDGLTVCIRKKKKDIRRIVTAEKRSLVERPKTETPGHSKRDKLSLRQSSLQSRCYERKINFKEIKKIYQGDFGSITPKMRHIMLSTNKARIVKMNEIVKKSRGCSNFPGGLRGQSISPYERSIVVCANESRLVKKSSKGSGSRPRSVRFFM